MILQSRRPSSVYNEVHIAIQKHMKREWAIPLFDYMFVNMRGVLEICPRVVV